MARFTHASATPATLDVILRGFEESEDIPQASHRTAGGARLKYIVGTRIRKATLTLLLTSATEKANFQSFYRTATNANTRFTFIREPTYYGSDTWSAFFTSAPSYSHTQMPGSRILEELTCEIEDAPVAL